MIWSDQCDRIMTKIAFQGYFTFLLSLQHCVRESLDESLDDFIKSIRNT